MQTSRWIPVWVEVPITVTLDAYTANDVVGGTLTSAMVPQVLGGGYIAKVRLVDDADQAEPFNLHCYNAAPSTIADGATFAPTEADWLKWLGSIPLTTYNQSGSDACCLTAGKEQESGDFVYFDNLESGYMYFRLECTATPDYADADDLTLHLLLMVR